MSPVDEIQYQRDKTPEQILQELFELDYFLSEKGTAFINVSYDNEDAPGGVTGCKIVHQNLLENYRYTVSQSACSPYIISVKLLDVKFKRGKPVPYLAPMDKNKRMGY